MQLRIMKRQSDIVNDRHVGGKKRKVHVVTSSNHGYSHPRGSEISTSSMQNKCVQRSTEDLPIVHSDGVSFPVSGRERFPAVERRERDN